MTRNTATTAVILVGMLLGSSAFAGREADVAAAGKLLSVTSSPNAGQTEMMYRVPLRSRLVVTQACVQHTAMVIEVGDDDDRISFGARGCTNYLPGFVVAGGNTVSCDNGSGMERTCALVGIVEDLPAQTGQRVRFHDLRQ
jgi:hypothetical protein